MSDQEKDLEIMILRYQLDMTERKLQSPLKLTRVEKLTLAMLLTKLKQGTQSSLRQPCPLFGLSRFTLLESTIRNAPT